jgi:hypothetical protein
MARDGLLGTFSQRGYLICTHTVALHFQDCFSWSQHLDRKSPFLRLARSEVAPVRASSGTGETGAWAGALSRWGLPLPDAEPLICDGTVVLAFVGRCRRPDPVHRLCLRGDDQQTE